MKRRLLAALLSSMLIGAGSARAYDKSAEGGDVADAKADNRLPKLELTSDWLHQFLVAEIAGFRGQFGLSTSAYRDLAKATRDPRIVQRAADIAFHARQYEVALEMARLWLEVDPESQSARQMLVGALAGSGRKEELVTQIAKLLANEGPNLGKALLRLPRIFVRNQDKDAVQQWVDQLTAPYLGIAEAHFVRATAALDARDAVRAKAEAARALALRPDWEQAALLRARATARNTETVEDLKTFVEANPKAHDARLALARGLVTEKRYEEARREFGRILDDNPDNAEVIYAVAVLSLQLNDASHAERHLRRLLELGSSEANSARLYLGQIAEDRKRLDEARQWYLQVGPGEQYLNGRVRLSSVLTQMGRHDEARRVLKETTATTPRERAKLISGEAQILRESGHPDQAYQVLEDGLKALPNQPELLYDAALAAERIGRPEVLERYLRTLIQMRPDHAQALNALGYSFADRNERLEEAKQLIEKALELMPEEATIVDSLGWVRYRMGDLPGALTLLTRAYSMNDDPEIAAHLGEVLWMLGRRDEAKKTWDEATRTHPNNAVLTATVKRFLP